MTTQPVNVPNLISNQRQVCPTRPPTTQGWPLLGVLPALWQQQATFLTSARARYGDIYTLDLGLFKAIMLNHPAHVQHVFGFLSISFALAVGMIETATTKSV